MRIAILSDSHDQVLHLHRAIDYLHQAGVEILIHCGDLISPFMLKHLSRFKGQVHLIYGNNAGDQHLVSSRSKELENIHHHGIFGFITVDGLKIAFHHYPELAHSIAKTGEFDVICYGHNHICETQYMNGCLLLNPGDLLGKEVAPGFLIFNTADTSVERITVGTPMDFEAQFSPTIHQMVLSSTPSNQTIIQNELQQPTE
ncbi:MAG: YfcE family phosphodiesterase [Desulfobulbus propionicus]|nr:MAG: YfcE family phosphodiesterase [Desulfobulbus propionicus]PIE65929.1 MAG: YfcE family phosphodiesterase [Desulfobacterales bacterium]